MLYFVSAELALAYWLFAFFSAVGALQWVAARYRLRGIAFFDYRRNASWGYALAAVLIVGSAVAFFVSQWEAIFAPGPAGSELAVLFASSAACALAATIVGASMLQRGRRSITSAAAYGDDGGLLVAVGHAAGRLYTPPGPTALAPAICLVPGYGTVAATASRHLFGEAAIASRHLLGETEQSMFVLASRMAQEGVVALVIHPDEESYSYPAILAVVPAAIAVLGKRPEVDPARMGLLGDDLGANLVIRSAGTSKEIKAVAALAPVLAEVPIGLDLLREMPYFRAMRWARDRKRATLRKELNALEYGDRIAPRPFLLLYGEEDNLASTAALAQWEAQQKDSMQLIRIPQAGHFDLVKNEQAMQIIGQWFKEHL